MNRLAELRKITVESCADTVAPTTAVGAVLDQLGAAFYEDYRQLLDESHPDVVVIATPPHLHEPMAEAALERGYHIYVEKPPVVTMAGLERLEELRSRSGLLCQVGFQTLGSSALMRVRALLAGNELGTSLKVYAAGHWRRDSAYWTRSQWAGRDTIDGIPVHDGALTNPFAHALMNCLAILTAETLQSFDAVDVERYRANQIEVDDTSVVRVRTRLGAFTVAVTLCAERSEDPSCTVAGEIGMATWPYLGDRLSLRMSDGRQWDELYGRVGLLEELVDVIAGRQAELSSPLGRSTSFVNLLELIVRQPVSPISPRRIAIERVDDRTTAVVNGIDQLIDEAASTGRLFSELCDPGV
jgi:predicted dehydrogenase